MNKRVSYWRERFSYTSSPYSDADVLTPERKRVELAIRYFKEKGVKAPFDCGCGCGYALERYLEEGFEPVYGSDFQPELVEELRRKFKNPKVEMFCWDITEAPPNHRDFNFDACSLFSVLPYVEDWGPFFYNIISMAQNSFYFAASFPNILFDFFSVNTYTGNLFKDHLIASQVLENYENSAIRELEKFFQHIPEHDPQGAYADVYYFRRENPLTIGQKLQEFGCRTEQIFYINYHPIPPRFQDSIPKNAYKLLKEKKEEDFDDVSWTDMFTHSTFLVLGCLERTLPE